MKCESENYTFVKFYPFNGNKLNACTSIMVKDILKSLHFYFVNYILHLKRCVGKCNIFNFQHVRVYKKIRLSLDLICEFNILLKLD